MSINIRTDFMQHAELFGNPVLFTNWLIQRDTIPKDWYCYDLRGTRQSPNVKIALVDKTARYHAGTVLSPTPLKRKETASRRVNSAFHLLGEEMTLEQFCEEHSLEYPQDDRKFAIKAASFDEAALFYAMTPEEDQRLGCIGHVRMDFGHRGQEFWHTWWPRGPEELNSPEFKAELQEVVDELRTSVLKDLAGMTKYCWGHGGEVGGWPANYGYIVETENYRYCLRCNPVPGDYQAYDMNSGQVCDELEIALHRGDGSETALSYHLNAAEKEVLLRKMEDYCQEQTGMGLAEYSAQIMAEAPEPPTGPTM